MIEFEITEKAIDDLAKIYDHIDKNNSDMAKRFTDELIINAKASITTFPS